MSLRGVAVSVAIYFAGVWMLLAQSHRYAGAGILFSFASIGGLWVARTIELRASSSATMERTTPARAPAPSIHETIEAHSAEPEPPGRQRARYLGALGHELRNPLNSVTGFSDILLSGADGELNPEQQRSVRTIRASAERLLRLVTTVVDQARVDAGTLRLQPQWVVPSELVADAIRFLRPRADGRDVVGEVTEGLPRVFVDRHRTVHALTGLAVLVIRSGGSGVSIRVAPPRRDQVGKGFVQFDLTTHLEDSSFDTIALVERLEGPSSPTDALGLEVSVSRSIIEAQGGRIWAEAGTAGALRVCMTLPTSS